MFYVAEAADIPTTSSPSTSPFFRVVERSEQAAREALATALTQRGASAHAAVEYANATESVWTDFGELGVTARVSVSA